MAVNCGPFLSTIWLSKESKVKFVVIPENEVLLSKLKLASSNNPTGGESEGEEATTITTMPVLLAFTMLVFSTIVDNWGVVKISLVNLTKVGSKVKTTRANATKFAPESTVILIFVAGGKLTTGGSKETVASATGKVGVG